MKTDTRGYRRAKASHSKRRRRRLNVEMLEDRRLLATMTDGTETLVNDFTTGTQTTRAETYAVDGNAAGDFAVAFDGWGPDGFQEIYLRRFDSTSTPIGSQILVNVTTNSNQRYASVAMGAAGESVVAWSGPGAGDNDGGVFVRLFDSSGTAVSGEILVNQTTASMQQKPVLAKASDGSFLVVWSGKGVGDTVGIFARRFAANGVPLTGEFLVNSTTSNNQQNPAVDYASDGSFVIAWDGTGPADAGGVFLQRFNAAGSPVGPETRVNTTIVGNQKQPSVGIDGANNFLVTWHGKGAGDASGIFGQWYDAGGTPLGGETLINTTTLYDQEDASVGMAPSGTAVVTWTSIYQDGSVRGVIGREFSPGGAPIGPEFVVNTTTANDQKFSSVGMRGENFTVAWHGRGVGDNSGVFIQSYSRNTPPEIVSDGGGDTASVNADENQTFVTNVNSIDAEGDVEGAGLSYTITGGADSALFSVSAATGVVTFLSAPDFENPTDAGTDGTYDVQVTVTDSGGLTDSQDIAVTVDDVNDSPVITSDGGGATASVNAAENQTSVTTVTASDEDLPAQTLTFTITGGADQALFGITAGGILTFNSAPDFENPTDSGGNNVYDVEVTVTDNGIPNLTDVQDIAVTVDDVNENPVIISDGGGATAAVNAAENQTFVTDVQSVDDANSEGAGLSYTISGGADAAFFSIGTLSGVVTFNSAPDFENPTDAGGNGVYDLQVTVTDSGAPNLTDVQDIAVTVTDVNENPVITSDGGGATASINVDENMTAVTTVTATDEDLPAQTLTFTITGGADQALFGITAGGILTFNSAPDFENPTDSGGNNVYDVEVTVTDNGIPNLTDVQDIAVTVDDVNENPVIISDGGGATAAVNAAENQTFVTDVQSVDDANSEGAGLSYTISGGADAAFFSIGTLSGVVTFNSAPDFENPTDAGGNGVYDLQVTVTDSGAPNLTDVQDIAVTVTDVNENPVITSDGGGATASVNVDENTTAVTTGTATDEDLPAQTLTWTITGGADSALFGITAGGVLTFNAAPDFENPTDNGGDNVYDVEITVTDNGAGNLTDVQDIAVTVDDVDPESTAVIDSYTGILGNVGLDVPAGNGLLSNDLGGPTAVTQVNASGANVGNPTATVNGTVTVQADGSFLYEPNVGNLAADSFTYELDNATTATVNLNFGTDVIWFIDVNHTGADLGTLSDPFQSISNYNGVAAAGDEVFIADGGATGPLNLFASATVVGEGATGVTGVLLGVTEPTDSRALPAVGGAAPVITSVSNGINLAADNTVRGVDIGNTGGTGINGTNVGALFVREVGISGTGGGVDLRSVAGSSIDVVLNSLSASSSSDEGILLSNVSGDFDITATTGAISATGIPGIDITGDSAASRVDLGIELSSVTVSGGNVGINLTNTSGAFTVGTANISNISQTTADTFNSVSGRPTSVGNGNGILLNTSSATFTVNGGTIEDIADNAVDIRNSNNTTLNNVTIQDGGDANTHSSSNTAIQWHLGSNLTLNNVTIEDIGDNIVIPTGGVNIQDSGIKAYDVSGDLNIIDSLFDGATGYVFANAVVGSEDRAVEVDNDTGTDLDVTVEGSTFRDFDFQALNLRHIGGSLDASIGGPTAGDVNTFQNINGAAVSTGPSVQSATGNVHGLEVENNTFTSVGIAVEVFSARGNSIGGVEGTHAFIEDNTINGTISDAFRLNAFAIDGGAPVAGSNNPIFRASLSNNTVNGLANLAPNNGGGSVFFVAAEDNADSDVTINNHPNLSGLAGGGTNTQMALTTQNQRSGDLDLVFTNNVFTNFPNSDENNFGFAFLGSDLVTNSPQTQTAVRFGGNDWNNLAGGFFETVFIDAGDFATMDVEGYAGGPNDDAALGAYLNSVDSDVFTFGFLINTGDVTGNAASVTGPTAFPTTPLLAAGGQGAGAAAINASALNSIVDAAIGQLLASGLTAAQQAALDDVTFSLVDLTDGMLGQASGNQIFIDIDAAGWGWFVDSTPDDDVEFGVGGDAEGRMDLLTAVMHELGHVLGHDHDDGVMSDTLETGTRADLDAFFASLD